MADSACCTKILCSISHASQVRYVLQHDIKFQMSPIHDDHYQTSQHALFSRTILHDPTQVHIMAHYYNSNAGLTEYDIYRQSSFNTFSTQESSSSRQFHPQTSPTIRKSKVIIEGCKDRLSKCFQRPHCPCSRCSSKTHLFKNSTRRA